MKHEYIFPENLRAVTLNDLAQANKVLEEANEVYKAVLTAEGRKRVLEEVLDTIHACEGILRRYTQEEIQAMVIEVYEKNKKRGDYL